MQTTIDYEQIVLNNLRQLSPIQQQEVVDFTEFLRQKFTQPSTGSLSLRQLASLPIKERHRYLQATIAATANDFLNDSELTEFAALDGEDWGIEHD
jgi:hypothetical protein